MLKHFEKHRLGYGILLLAAAFAAALGGVIFVRGDTGGTAVLTVFVALAALGIALIAGGVVAAAVCLCYIALLGLGVAATLFAENVIQLPGTAGLSFGIALALVVILAFHAPQKLGERVRAHLREGQDPSQAAQTPQGAAARKAAEQEHYAGYDYKAYEQYKASHAYGAKPYALENVGPVFRRLRTTASVLLFAAGVVGFIAFANMQPDPAQPGSVMLRGVAVSLLCLFYAAGVLICGFARGLLFPAVPALACGSVYWVFSALSAVRSLPALLPWVAALLAAAVWLLLAVLFVSRIGRSRVYNNIQTYTKAGEFFAVDCALHDVRPVKDYTALLEFAFRAVRGGSDLTPAGYGRIARFVKGVLRAGVRKQFIFAAFTIAAERNLLTLFIYCRPSERVAAEEAVYTAARRRGIESQEVAAHDDARWEYYSDSLYPDKYAVVEMFNDTYLAWLEKIRFNTDIARKLVFSLRLPSEETARSCIAQLQKNGYDVQESTDPADGKESADGEVYINAGCVSRMGLYRLNLTTRALIDWAAQAGGELVEWYVDPKEFESRERRLGLAGGKTS
ncbi:MAG: ribonuclease E inhibitor RraB [Clostridia bacterium]|nr:ribonuclease E inhibitor RraB [Clostridia bacterium]